MNEPRQPEITEDDTVQPSPMPVAETPDASSQTWRPADYYAKPPATPRLPRWVTIASGVAAIVALAAMFAIGVFLRSGGLSLFVALAIGQFQGELKGMLAEDVDGAATQKLDDSLREVRKRLTEGSIPQSEVLPLLEEIQKASRDEKVTAAEIDALQSVVDEIEVPQPPAARPVEL